MDSMFVDLIVVVVVVVVVAVAVAFGGGGFVGIVAEAVGVCLFCCVC